MTDSHNHSHDGVLKNPSRNAPFDAVAQGLGIDMTAIHAAKGTDKAVPIADAVGVLARLFQTVATLFRRR